MAIFKKVDGTGAFVWGADPSTDAEKTEAGAGWYFAAGQSDDCTFVEVRALGDDDAREAARSDEAAWRLGVINIDGAKPNRDEWPPLFVAAVEQLVRFVASGMVGLHPPAP